MIGRRWMLAAGTCAWACCLYCTVTLYHHVWPPHRISVDTDTWIQHEESSTRAGQSDLRSRRRLFSSALATTQPTQALFGLPPLSPTGDLDARWSWMRDAVEPQSSPR
ncbi:hypothetical protein HDK90DRAFT_227014 [Phyllosticta capitalensis]|uniref:Secreted protein n=1 Tax=Phyllosticta capitalensis TaxID=121624 RepID=A0ABR1YU30_9PEZI